VLSSIYGTLGAALPKVFATAGTSTCIPSRPNTTLGMPLSSSTAVTTTFRAEPKYGILPFVLSSIYGTLGASLIGVPVGLLTAGVLSEAADDAGQDHDGQHHDGRQQAGARGLAKGFCHRRHHAVPPEYEQGSLALGATDTETWFKISIPAAKSGIAAGIVLGIGRAIGEAMAVMMVAGNSPNMPDSLFRSVTFLTTAIAKEMSYASGLQKQALFSIALVLFVFIMAINVLLNAVLKGGNKPWPRRWRGRCPARCPRRCRSLPLGC